jgi:hypothetical protein
MFKKKVLSIYSEDIRGLFFPEVMRLLGKSATFSAGKVFVNGIETKVLDWFELEAAKSFPDEDVNICAVGYVVGERPFQYKNKTKQATELTIDIGGAFYKEVIWPQKDANVSPVGFKKNPVFIQYSTYKDKLSLSKVTKLLSAEEISKYHVI